MSSDCLPPPPCSTALCGPHPSDPVSPWPAWSKPVTVQLPCGSTTLSLHMGAAAPLNLARTISSFYPRHSPHILATEFAPSSVPFFFFFNFNVPVLISLLLQTGLHSTLWGTCGPQALFIKVPLIVRYLVRYQSTDFDFHACRIAVAAWFLDVSP